MLKKLGKLLKYEFRFYFRLLPPLYLVLVLLSLFAGYRANQSGVHNSVFAGIWVAIITAMTVMNAVLIIQRFTDNFMKNPGSLMFTLPVTSWALTASKAIAALCIVLVSTVVISISVLIYGMVWVGWSPEWINIQISFADGLIYALIGIILILQQVCLIYAVISASHLLPRFRFAAGILIYFALMNFVIQPVLRYIGPWGGYQRHFYLPESSLLMIPYGIAGFVFAAIFFCATGFLLKRRLNLE